MNMVRQFHDYFPRSAVAMGIFSRKLLANFSKIILATRKEPIYGKIHGQFMGIYVPRSDSLRIIVE